MRRESYLSQPSEIEIYPVFSGTDVILRQSIELVEREEIQDGKKSKYKQAELSACDSAVADGRNLLAVGNFVCGVRSVDIFADGQDGTVASER